MGRTRTDQRSLSDGARARRGARRRRLTFAAGLWLLATSAGVVVSFGPVSAQQTPETLAYSAEGARELSHVWTVNTDGTGRTDLGEGSAPAWSPDGTTIAFVHAELGNFDIWTMRPDGSERRRLTEDPAADTDPAWSPDGRSIAFASERIRSFDIFVMNADGSNETARTVGPEAQTEPSWSPDGQQIAFTSANSDGSAVFTMSADGTGREQLTSALSDRTPAWSPDGTTIAFVSFRTGYSEIYTVPSTGGDENAITSVETADDPSWSPDSTRLAFGAVRPRDVNGPGGPRIYTINGNGTKLFEIDSATGEWDPAWRPPTAVVPTATDPPPVPTAAPPDQGGPGTEEDPAEREPADETPTAAQRRRTAASQTSAESTPDAARVQAQGLERPATDERTRSMFPASLLEPKDVRFDPAALAGSALIAALVPLLLFPAILFNNTLEEHYDEVVGWFRRKGKEPRATAAAGWRANLLRLIPLAVVATLAALFLDPELDVDRASLALFVGLLGAFALTTLVDFAPVLYLRQRRERPGSLRTYVGAIVVLVVGVALSRAVGFEPGYLYGTLAGFAMASTITGTARGWAQTVSVAALLAWAIVAWVVWIPIGHAAEGTHPGMAILILDSLLAAAFVGGIETSLFALVPLRFLEGKDIFDHNRPIWIGLSMLAAFAFVHVLLAPSVGYGGSVVVMLALFAVFGGASVAFWAYFRYRTPRETGLDATQRTEAVATD